MKKIILTLSCCFSMLLAQAADYLVWQQQQAEETAVTVPTPPTPPKATPVAPKPPQPPKVVVPPTPPTPPVAPKKANKFIGSLVGKAVFASYHTRADTVVPSGASKNIQIRVEVKNGKKTTEVVLNGKKLSPNSKEYQEIMATAGSQFPEDGDFEEEDIFIFKEGDASSKKIKKIKKTQKGDEETIIISGDERDEDDSWIEKSDENIIIEEGDNGEQHISIRKGFHQQDDGIEKFKSALVKDGLLKNKNSSLDFDLSNDGLKVNGRRQSAAMFEKYKKLYEEIMGKSWCPKSQYQIKMSEIKRTRI